MNAVFKLDRPFHVGAVARWRLGDESAALTVAWRRLRRVAWQLGSLGQWVTGQVLEYMCVRASFERSPWRTALVMYEGDLGVMHQVTNTAVRS